MMEKPYVVNLPNEHPILKSYTENLGLFQIAENKIEYTKLNLLPEMNEEQLQDIQEEMDTLKKVINQISVNMDDLMSQKLILNSKHQIKQIYELFTENIKK